MVIWFYLESNLRPSVTHELIQGRANIIVIPAITRFIFMFNISNLEFNCWCISANWSLVANLSICNSLFLNISLAMALDCLVGKPALCKFSVICNVSIISTTIYSVILRRSDCSILHRNKFLYKTYLNFCKTL